ncbi:MAG TPA: 30S ribosomal protein S4 [Candidatus Saccharimonadales bacterium]|nr:30S ribosomal protein S4 [Candidatus Saccharimonadales bacterium]
MADYPTPNTSTTTTKANRSNKRPKKVSEYGKQLQEKQKTRNSYGLREAQFKKYFDAAAKFRGQTGELLLQTLERRLDNVVFRAGFARTRAQARQLVSHRHVTLNGSRISIPSISVKVGDVIAFHKEHEVSIAPETPKVDWLKVEPKKGKITVGRIPTGIDLPVEFDTQKIVEFYSK